MMTPNTALEPRAALLVRSTLAAARERAALCAAYVEGVGGDRVGS